jgi:hypothetical protein
MQSMLIFFSATIFLLGAILGVAGDSIIQLIPESVSSLIKVARTSHFDGGLRAIAFDSLRKIFIKHDSIKDESVSKDLIKVVRVGLAEKSNTIQVRAAHVSIIVVKHLIYSYWSKLHPCSILLHLRGTWKTLNRF